MQDLHTRDEFRGKVADVEGEARRQQEAEIEAKVTARDRERRSKLRTSHLTRANPEA
jgi:hypothetical protein